MKCSSPVSLFSGFVGCGQCMSCRINKNRIWAARLYGEACRHPQETIYFVTLTYDDDHLPVYHAPGFEVVSTLDKRDGRLFRMRVRRALGYQPRFFWIGEYGEDPTKSQRPHYHVLMYGLLMPFGQAEKFLQSHWPHGHLELRPFDPNHCDYISRYVLKKKTKLKDAPDDTPGSRLPEYAQMSRRPALGDGFVEALATKQKHHLNKTGDVSTVFRAGGKLHPFGDRHKRMLRRLAGVPELVGDLKRLNPHLFPAPEELSDKVIKGRLNREKQIANRAKIFKGPRL